MPSANKTPNYNLTQYANNGNDRVSFMGDYNSDMSKIDTQMNVNANSVGAKEDKTAHAADVTSLNAAIALKADASATTAALALKADASATTAALALKEGTDAHNADVTTINTAIALKADRSYVDSQLNNTYTKSETIWPTKPNETNVVDNRYYYGNVCRYGQTPGSGPIDTALQYALNNAFNGLCDVIIPSGTYTYSRNFDITSGNFQIYGQGQRPILKKTGTFKWMIDANGITIKNIEFDGQGNDESGLLVYGSNTIVENIYAHNHLGHGIDIDGSHVPGWTVGQHNWDTNVIRYCEAANNHGIGICTNDTTHADVLYCYTHDNNLEGITTDGTIACQVIGNRVDNNCLNGGAGGISMDTTQFLICSNNRITNTKGGRPGIRINNETGSTADCVFVGNVMQGNSGRGFDGIAMYNLDNSIITGNKCSANAGGDTMAWIGNAMGPCNYPPHSCYRIPPSGQGLPGNPNTDLSVPADAQINWFGF